jgi:hypothetical protein
MERWMPTLPSKVPELPDLDQQQQIVLGVLVFCFLIYRYGPSPSYTIKRTVTVAGTVDQVFWYLADFGTTAAWDPNVKAARKLDGGKLKTKAAAAAKPRRGDSWELQTVFKGKTSVMEYQLHGIDAEARTLSLVGSSETVLAADHMTFSSASPSGVDIQYTLKLSLLGWRAPFLCLIGKDLEQLATTSLEGLVSECATKFGRGAKKAAAAANEEPDDEPAAKSSARAAKSPAKKRK